MFDEKNAKKKIILKEIAETEIDNTSRDSLEDTKRARKNSDNEFL